MQNKHEEKDLHYISKYPHLQLDVIDESQTIDDLLQPSEALYPVIVHNRTVEPEVIDIEDFKIVKDNSITFEDVAFFVIEILSGAVIFLFQFFTIILVGFFTIAKGITSSSSVSDRPVKEKRHRAKSDIEVIVKTKVVVKS